MSKELKKENIKKCDKDEKNIKDEKFEKIFIIPKLIFFE